MATGAGDRYWDKQRLPSVLKHELLRIYLPKFGGKTGSKSNGVVYLDGYAGRGRYEDLEPRVRWLNAISRSPKLRLATGSAIASSSTRQSPRTTPR